MSDRKTPVGSGTEAQGERSLTENPGPPVPVLTASGIDHDIKVYPEAGHGFPNDHDPGDLSRLDQIIAKLAAAAYHKPSVRDARRRILAFFRAHLIDAPASA